MEIYQQFIVNFIKEMLFIRHTAKIELQGPSCEEEKNDQILQDKELCGSCSNESR